MVRQSLSVLSGAVRTRPGGAVLLVLLGLGALFSGYPLASEAGPAADGAFAPGLAWALLASGGLAIFALERGRWLTERLGRRARRGLALALPAVVVAVALAGATLVALGGGSGPPGDRWGVMLVAAGAAVIATVAALSALLPAEGPARILTFLLFVWLLPAARPLGPRAPPGSAQASGALSRAGGGTENYSPAWIGGAALGALGLAAALTLRQQRR